MIFSKDTSIRNVKNPFDEIVNSKHPILKEKSKENVDFRNKARVPGLCPYWFGKYYLVLFDRSFL